MADCGPVGLDAPPGVKFAQENAHHLVLHIYILAIVLINNIKVHIYIHAIVLFNNIKLHIYILAIVLFNSIKGGVSHKG